MCLTCKLVRVTDYGRSCSVAKRRHLSRSPFASTSVLLMGSASLPSAVEKPGSENPEAKLSFFPSFYFPIRREGMISLLAVAKSSGECVCGFLAVNEQIQTLLNGRLWEGEVIHMRAWLIIASQRQKMEEIAL